MLKGKVAVITGGTRGIGLSIVKKFLENGCRVALFGSREETVNKAIDDLKKINKDYQVIGFYPREFYPLDNFSSFKVEWNGYLYASLEEAYQAASFMGSNEELVEKVKKSHSADEAQRIAYANRDKQRTDWNEVKLEIMEELLRLKVEQNPYVKKKLLQTENYLIVEDSPKDSFWGWGPNRDGENQLGKLWMKLREELKKDL